MKKKVNKNHLGVQKYNRILQVLIQNARKSDLKYVLKDFQQKASSLYGGFRDKSIKTITAESVAEAKEVTLLPTQRKYKERVTKINAIDVPNGRWFDGEFNWYEIGEHVVLFSQAYPTIPVVVKTAKNRLSFVGTIETYNGSIVQDFTEKLRIEYDNSSKAPTLIGTKGQKGKRKRQFAFWGDSSKEDEFPDVIEQKEINAEIQKLVDEREEFIDKKIKLKNLEKKELKKQLKKAEKKLLPKIESVKPTLKKITKEKTDNRETELRKVLEILKEDLKDGTLTKKQYLARQKQILDKFAKGGLIK